MSFVFTAINAVVAREQSQQQLVLRSGKTASPSRKIVSSSPSPSKHSNPKSPPPARTKTTPKKGLVFGSAEADNDQNNSVRVFKLIFYYNFHSVSLLFVCMQENEGGGGLHAEVSGEADDNLEESVRVFTHIYSLFIITLYFFKSYCKSKF